MQLRAWTVSVLPDITEEDLGRFSQINPDTPRGPTEAEQRDYYNWLDCTTKEHRTAACC